MRKPPAEAANGVSELKELLDRLRKLCEDSGDEFASFGAKIAALEERLSAERFHLAVLGQFKRGKSTLLNALIGESLLPTGVVPLTSIPTFLHAGEKRAARIVFFDDRETNFADLSLEQARDILARHVTEQENPGNRLGVARVEIQHPSSLLPAGVVLIDTPGIGSTYRHNTDATLSFLPQCDAALFIVSADPPITAVEQEFLKAVQNQVSNLCFVMNKVDYLSESELADAVLFFEKALKETGVPEQGEIFRVSGKQGIDARMKQNAWLWRESGVEELQNYLLDFLSREKARTLRQAIAKKAGDVVADAAMNIELQRRSLALSQEELERHIGIFDSRAKGIEVEAIKIADLLTGDKKRAVQFLEDRAADLKAEARRHLGELVSAVFNGQEPLGTMEQRARDLLAQEIPPFFGAKLAAFYDQVNLRLEAVIAPYQKRLDDLVGALRSTAAGLFDIPYRAPEDSGVLEMRHKPYWVTQKWNTSISPLPEGFADRFLPTELRNRQTRKRLSEEVESLVVRNVENIRWATLRNLEEAFRRFAVAFDEGLKQTAETTRSAMRAAHLRQREKESRAQREFERLWQQAAQFAELENALRRYGADS